MKTGTTRRHTLLRGLAGAGVLAVGGVAWRAWDTGVFSVGEGPAYEPWRSWGRLEGAMALIQSAILAANAHNTQPWRFTATSDTITLSADYDRHLGSFDPFRREMHLSLGCALENLVHAARAQGLEAHVELLPGRLTQTPSAEAAGPAAIVRLAPADKVATDLLRAIPLRHTHRAAYLPDRPVPEQHLKEMQALVPEALPLRLFLLTGDARAQLGALIVSATQAIVTDARMAADSARWFRFDWDAVQKHRDGITLDAVGLAPLVNAAAKILPRPSNEQADRQWLDATRDVHVATAPLLGTIAVRDLYDRPTALAAGRLWQRLHLWLTARGLVAQPLNQPAEMVDRERELDAPARTAQALARLAGDAGWHPTFVFRAGYADRPARWSPRRPVESVLAA